MSEWTEAYDAGRNFERERCAKIADEHAAVTVTGQGSETAAGQLVARSIAAAIRNWD